MPSVIVVIVMVVVIVVVVIPSVIPPGPVPAAVIPRIVERVVPRRIVPGAVPRAAEPEAHPETVHRSGPHVPRVGVIARRQDIHRRVEAVEALSVDPVILLDQHHLGGGLFVGVICFVVQAIGLGLEACYLVLALGDGEAVVGAVEVVGRRCVIPRGTATGKGHHRQKCKKQLFHGRILLYM
jgi:hypothetical protein